MRIDDRTMPAISFEDFAAKHGLTMRVNERPASIGLGPSRRYYASFVGAEVKDGPFLRGEYGDGVTKAEAISNYSRIILGQRLVIDAYTKERREIQCPNEWSTP